MQVTDRNIGANPTGFDMRTEINNIIAALESDNSGSSEPLNTVAYMKWLDTSNATYYYYKERNHNNTAWVTLFRYTVATKIMEVVNNGTDLTTTLALKAPLASPTFTGTPLSTTPANGDNSTKIATTAFVKTKSELDSIGVNQTWTNVLESRTSGVTYTNSTGKPIQILVTSYATVSGNTGIVSFNISGIVFYAHHISGTANANFESVTTSLIIPNGATYLVTSTTDSVISAWLELR